MARPKKGYQRPSGPIHGAKIREGKTAKKLAEQLKHCEHQNKRLQEASTKADESFEVIASYIDLVASVWHLVPKDTTATHGPTRRMLRAQTTVLLKKANDLGVPIFQD